MKYFSASPSQYILSSVSSQTCKIHYRFSFPKNFPIRSRNTVSHTMSCFNFFKSKSSKNQQTKSSTSSALTSNANTSKSYDSSSTQQLSKSTASTSSQQSNITTLYEERAHNLRVFEINELRNATNDFNRMVKIGEGGFGSVYKGFISPVNGIGDKIPVVVKRLNQKSWQNHKLWLAEVQFFGAVEHKNLVKLIGYCSEDGERGIQRLLVYEFMPNNSLADHLFKQTHPCLPWKLRLQIALGVAEGLAYLHEGLEVQVIYRDLKASHVLLNEEFMPKLSDFAIVMDGRSDVSIEVVEAHGYAAPEYIEIGRLTTKSDIWSFGVVLYELLTGRHSLDRNRPTNEQTLVNWVSQLPVDNRKFSMIMDPRLKNQYSLKAAREIAKLAERCVLKQAKERPKTSDVVEILRLIINTNDS